MALKPTLDLWGARALYIGPALGLTAHRNPVGVVVIGIDGEFGLARDPGNPETGWDTAHSAVIPPGMLHELGHTPSTMGFLYMDAQSRDLQRVMAAAGRVNPRAAYDLALDADLRDILSSFAGGEISRSDSRSRLAVLLGDSIDIDPRVRSAVAQLHANPSARPSLEQLAGEAGFSPGHFARLFRTATGIPLRRYRLWVAMGAAMRSIMNGNTLTEAAFQAGFSSSAHFSTTFRAMFGLEPSRLRAAVGGD